MVGAKSEPDLEIVQQDTATGDFYEENKENFSPHDKFDDNNLK